jgi:DNA-binding MarR family transcriptional regulator
MPNAEPHPRAGADSQSRPGSALLFLREEEIRAAQTMLLLAWRDFAGAADPVLDSHGLGRAHHRALHFICSSPGMTVTDLLSVLAITKQSLSRVLGTLTDKGYIRIVPGRADRRQRLLHLTPSGEALERALFDRQREKLVAAYREAGGPAVEGFRRVLRCLIGRGGQGYLGETLR